MKIIECLGCNKEIRVFNAEAQCPFCYFFHAKEYVNKYQQLNILEEDTRTIEKSMSEALLEYYSRKSADDHATHVKAHTEAEKHYYKKLAEGKNIEPADYGSFKYKEKVKTLGVRHNTDKYKMSLIPPQFLEGLAKVLTDGEKKYGKENLIKGNYVSVPYDSAIRHLHAFMKGENLDSESGSHHLFHAAANLMMMFLYHTKPELDDRSFKDEEK